MKANRIYRNDNAEVGVGTLIVFIAMVLVAAVAAAVLINTSGLLQERASNTGKEATEDVSSNLHLVSVIGKVASGKVSELYFQWSLASGAPSLDANKTIIRYSDGTVTKTFKYNEADDPLVDTDAFVADKFNLDWVRDIGGAAANEREVMSSGDLVDFGIDMGTDDIGVRKTIEVVFVPEVGSPVAAHFTTPSTYNGDTWVTLRG